MKKVLTLLIASFACHGAFAQADPYLSYWWYNTTNNTINGIRTDVDSAYYDSSYVYVKASGVPHYVTFGATHNDPSDRAYTYRLPRHPQHNTGTPVGALGGGGYGVLLDGSQLFNPEDARTYNNAGIWHQIAYFFEGVDFDTTNGHSTPTNEYHHHIGPKNYYNSDSSKHSKLIGFAFDGFPVYGPFGYSDPNDTTSHTTRMTPSYHTRNISDRNTLPDGTVSPGPVINNTYPLGGYREDYEYIAGSGILDDHNGRLTKTPDFPNGTYAYFITVDSAMKPIYPYIFGQSLYGTADNGAFGPMGNKYTIPGTTILYVLDTTTGISDAATNALNADISFYPNPTVSSLNITVGGQRNIIASLYTVSGDLLYSQTLAGSTTAINVSQYANGMYLLNLRDVQTGASVSKKLIKQ